MKSSKSHIIALSLLMAGAVLPASGKLSVRASLDSTQIIMGEMTAIKLDIVESASSAARLIVDKEKFPKELEVVDWVYGDTADIGNGLVEMKRALVVQGFDSGVYNIPPFLLAAGPDTVRSNGLTLKVNPVDVSEMKDINPLADVAKFQSKWYDWLPDFITDYWLWLLFGLLVIAGGISAYLILTKKVAVSIIPQKKRLPPDQIAENRLNALKEAQLWEKGQEKEYYTQLIDILRDYLQERFGINAMEMTSSQILAALQGNEATRQPNMYMRKIIEVADFVKFAKVRPMPDDNVRSWQNAMQFVEETRPVVEEPAEEDDQEPKGTPAPSAPSDKKKY